MWRNPPWLQIHGVQTGKSLPTLIALYIHRLTRPYVVTRYVVAEIFTPTSRAKAKDRKGKQNAQRLLAGGAGKPHKSLRAPKSALISRDIPRMSNRESPTCERIDRDGNLRGVPRVCENSGTDPGLAISRSQFLFTLKRRFNWAW